MPSKILILALAAGVLACANRAVAQGAPSEAITSTVALAAVTDYQVGPGDMLTIRVSGVREFDQSIRVSNSGRIRVPYVGIMFAAGMTAVELEREIARAIREHELVNEPMVRVQIDQQRALPAFVVGEVAMPGQFSSVGEMYLLDLITRAGGLTGMADGKAFVYRRAPPRPKVEARIMTGTEPSPEAPPPSPVPDQPLPAGGQVIPIDLDQLQDGSRPDLNIPLLGGDVLYVPRRQVRTFYIIGDVKVPGAYGMPRRGDVSAAQAIIYAGGPLATAKSGSAFLMRHDANGERQAIPVDFNAIIKGKKPDVPVQSDDIIFIPNSAIKTIGTGFLAMVPQLVVQLIIF